MITVEQYILYKVVNFYLFVKCDIKFKFIYLISITNCLLASLFFLVALSFAVPYLVQTFKGSHKGLVTPGVLLKASLQPQKGILHWLGPFTSISKSCCGWSTTTHHVRPHSWRSCAPWKATYLTKPKSNLKIMRNITISIGIQLCTGRFWNPGSTKLEDGAHIKQTVFRWGATRLHPPRSAAAQSLQQSSCNSWSVCEVTMKYSMGQC